MKDRIGMSNSFFSPKRFDYELDDDEDDDSEDE